MLVDLAYVLVIAAAIEIVVVLSQEIPTVREPFRRRNVAIGQMAAALALGLLVVVVVKIIE
jgi:hypothetical protein